ncbi:MAG: metallophosphoesterase [Phycisphaera sp.]|nr:metallophosphoesterase [Phycisphaera sp.]
MKPLRHALGPIALGAIIVTTGCTCDPTERPATVAGHPSIRIATWNIKHGRGLDDMVDLARTTDVLRTIDADVVALQEVDERVRRSGGVDQARRVGDDLDMHPMFGSFMDHQGGRYGLAILSRLPVDSSEEWRLSDGNEPRVALSARLESPDGGILTVIAVHFDWVDDDGFRFKQATETMRRIRELDTPWVVLGDFNDTPDSRTMQGFRELGRDASKPEDARHTFPADDPRIEIDFIVVGPPERWRIDEVVVIDETIASDHRPVRAVLSLLPSGSDEVVPRRKKTPGS